MFPTFTFQELNFRVPILITYIFHWSIIKPLCNNYLLVLLFYALLRQSYFSSLHLSCTSRPLFTRTLCGTIWSVILDSLSYTNYFPVLYIPRITSSVFHSLISPPYPFFLFFHFILSLSISTLLLFHLLKISLLYIFSALLHICHPFPYFSFLSFPSLFSAIFTFT